MIVFATLLVAGCSLYAAYQYFFSNIHAPVVHGHQHEIFVVQKGMTLDAILSKLERLGIIKSTIPLRAYIKATGQAPVIKAGDYRFGSPITPLAVLDVLKSGCIELDKLTIIEGWTRFEIAQAMSEIKSLKVDRQKALALTNQYRLIADIDPVAKNLEGYLFPDTYFVQSNTTAQDLIEQMVARARKVISEAQAQARGPRLSTHNAVTMASIVETEAKLKVERPIIASVINNRLARKMPLAMDSTIVYASKSIGKWKNDGIIYQSDLDLKTPYNTRKYAGLPPGPVGSPGLSSLQAVLTPATTNYLYYVREPSRDDGAHNFYADAAGFEIGVARLRQWEKQHRPHLN